MGSRILNAEFKLPPGLYEFNGRPPLRAADPGQETNQPRVYVPGDIVSWYGTQTIKAPGIELLVHLWYRPVEGEDGEAEIIWSGHQLLLQSGANNTVVIQSPSTIPYLRPGWVWVEFGAICPKSTPEENMMWEIQVVFFHTGLPLMRHD